MTNQQPASFEPRDDEGYEGPDVEMPVDGDADLGDTADDLNDSADSYVSPARTGADDSGEPKPDGLGRDRTIPDEPEGVAAGYTGEPSTFEPEEDGQSDG
ncbi:hypothetical protein [Microbacterium jejuense]|uniref:hypothetical protein n=1 Tax=Microbacterium jejuense TaxID=1263637 RepID=UPI001CB88341|nr:hypothetical protein [Microbacterium jejuense]